MKKIVYVTGTRADFGLMKHTLELINSNPKLDLKVIVTGMHLDEAFGLTRTEIEDSGLRYEVIDAKVKDDKAGSVAAFTGDLISKLVKRLDVIRPDAVLLLGDRPEMLAAASACLYLSIPAIHIHGGEVTGTFDEIARHAITKLSPYHIAATEESAERIRKLGEDPSRIHVFGAPGLDSITDGCSDIADIDSTVRYLGIEKKKPLMIVLHHPETPEVGLCRKDIKTVLEAVKNLGHQTVLIYPNADSGGRAMIQAIEKCKSRNIMAYKSIPRPIFLGLMNIADVMIGNSSSGIIEAPFFRLPAVNVGSRQRGRQRACNVIDVPADKEKIKQAVRKALSSQFRDGLKTCKSPYGDGRAGERIVKFLLKTGFSPDDVFKSITY